jgi:hypothetical protein
MRKRYGILSACLLVLTSCWLAITLAQDLDTGEIPRPEKMAEMMANWKSVINPGDQHKPLGQRVGSWETLTRTWTGGPGAKAVETRGSSVIQWVLGGRFIMEKHKGKTLMPDDEGRMKSMDFEGIGFMGFDNFKNMCENYKVVEITYTRKPE